MLFRITSDEFARFVYSISDGEYGTEEKGTPPDSLPGQFYAIYLAYGTLDFEYVGEDYYIGACAETMVAVKVASQASPVQTAAPTNGGEETLSPTTNFTVSEEFFASCKIALIIGDSVERDDKLSEEEYVRFLSRLLPDDIGMYDSFADLPPTFHTSFQSLAVGQTYIDVAGSKPNVEPTSDQLSHLEQICGSTEIAIADYHNGSGGGTPAPSSSTDDENLNDDGGDWNMTAAEFLSCRMSLMYSDLNRDDKLDSDEYLRFINRVLNTTTTTFQKESDLSPVFQSSFDTLSKSNGYIDVTGSKPAPLPTSDQLSHLEQVCKALGKAVSIYFSEDHDSDNNSTVAPAPDEFFGKCTAALSVADRDYNGVMSDDEYVRFINKLQGSTYGGMSSLSPGLQTNFKTISKGGSGVDISGASGSPTPSQLEQLTFVCSETEAIIEGGDDANDGMSEESFRQCQKALSSVDVNMDGWLEPVEYIDLLNLLMRNEFKGASFTKIDEMFRVSYEKSKGDNEFIDVAGASQGESATDEQTANLRSVCLELTNQISLYENPTTVEVSACLQSLQALLGDSHQLDPDAFLSLVKGLTGPALENVAYLEGFPFVVRNNFEWIKWSGEALDLSSLNDARSANWTESLQLSCEKTIVACDLALDVFAESNGTTLDFCTIPLSFADLNADNNLDQHEFHLFIDHLSGNVWAREDYNDLDFAIHEVFNSYVDSTTGLIQVHGSKPNDSPSESELDYLKTFCAKAEDAIAAARENSLFFHSCVRVLGASDTNGDASLSEEEYAKFVSVMTARAEVPFPDLDAALQKNFEVLKDSPSDQGVNVGGSELGQEASGSQEQHLRSFCNSTQDTLWALEIPTAPPFTGSDESFRVNNSFILSNVKGFKAKDLLHGLNRAGLNEAYGVFIDQFVSGTQAIRLRGRQLGAVTLLAESADIHRIEDSECPRSVVEGSFCLIAYAAFYLDKEPESTFQELSQEAINKGVLQAVLSRVDAQNDLVVVGAYQPTTENGGDNASSGGSLSLGAMIGIAVAVSCAIFGLVLFLYFHFNKETNFDCCAKRAEAKKAPPECSPYAVDYDHAMKPSINHLVAGPYNDDYGDASASEQFEDEPGQNSVFSPGSQGAKVERFNDEGGDESNGALAQAVGASNMGYDEATGLDRFEDEPEGSLPEVESQKAPVYIDNNYGELQEEVPTHETLFAEDDGLSGFSEGEAKSDAFDVNSDDDDFGFFASAKADSHTDRRPDDANNGGWDDAPEIWTTGTKSPVDVLSASGSSNACYVDPVSPGGASCGNQSRGSQSSKGSAVGSPQAKSKVDPSFAVGVDPVSNEEASEEHEDGGPNINDDNEEDEDDDRVERDDSSEGVPGDSDAEEGESHDDDSIEESEDEGSEASGSESESESGGSRESEAETIDDSIRNTRSQPFYKEIKALVAQVVPDELENVDAMMEQFLGKEEELLHTLQNMAGLSSEPGSSDESKDEGSDSQASGDDESSEGEDESEDESEGESEGESEAESEAESDAESEGGLGDEISEADDGGESSDEDDDGPSDEGSDSEGAESDQESEEADDSQADASGDEEEEEAGGANDASLSEGEEEGSEEDDEGSEEEGVDEEDEESYYSEEVVETSAAEESDQSGSGDESSSYEEESYHSENVDGSDKDEDDEETIDDEEETIDDEAEDDGSSSYCSDSD